MKMQTQMDSHSETPAFRGCHAAFLTPYPSIVLHAQRRHSHCVYSPAPRPFFGRPSLSSFSRPAAPCSPRRCYVLSMQQQQQRQQQQPAPNFDANDMDTPRISIDESVTGAPEHQLVEPELSGFALGDAPQLDFSAVATAEPPLRLQAPGAYAILDGGGNVAYMGYSRNVAAKLRFHRGLQPTRCVTFKSYLPPLPPPLVSPDVLENILEYWVAEIGYVPAGNTPAQRALWEQSPQSRKINNGSSNSVDSSTQAQNDTNSINDKNSTNNVSESDNIPIRERSTSCRTSKRVSDTQADPPIYSTDPFADVYRSSSQTYAASSSSSSPSKSAGKKAKAKAAAWDAADDDYVRVNVDPFDPFSASNRNKQTTRASWTDVDLDDDGSKDDWYPIFLIMGCGGLVWLFGLLSNALPAATPSLGM